MKQTLSRSAKRPVRYTLGRATFAKISAVEGIHLTADMERDLLEFDRQNLSPDERRRAIAAKYGTAR